MCVTDSPVNCDGPDDRCQQDFVSLEGKHATVKEKREMRPDHDGEPLSEVPVPGVRAVEISHTVQDVKLEEVELHWCPLENKEEPLQPNDFMLRELLDMCVRVCDTQILPSHRKNSQSSLK